MKDSIATIILAAGKGTRMNAPSTMNKVVFHLADKPIISYTVDMLTAFGMKKIVVVVGFAAQSVRDILGDKVEYAIQENPQGTGQAVKIALPLIPPEFDTIISMYGDDSAFYDAALIKKLVEDHRSHQAKITLVTIEKENPTGLGRIIRNENGEVESIVEEKNATEEEKAITEINTGLYCFDRSLLEQAIAELKPNPVSGEYYLTDVIGYATQHKEPVRALLWPNKEIWFGVNTPEDLKEAELRMKINK